jgi:hypothetical protein
VFRVSDFVVFKASAASKREKGTQQMVCSSGRIKWIHRLEELEMQEIIPMTFINEIHDGESVDDIHLD